MAIVAVIETEQQQQPAAAPPLLDPQLLMAARRGDSKRLKELLRLNDDGEEEETAASSEVVVVEVTVPRRRAAAAAAAASPSLPPQRLALDGVTLEGDTLLHVVAASGDGQEFLHCAKLIHDQSNKLLLVVKNHDGDTPLHCAARAGNARMISHLVVLGGGDTAAVTNKLLRLRNRRGETALHHAVRAASKAAIDQLLSVDPELALGPRDSDRDREGAAAGSPFYLSVSLGDMDIARHLLDAATTRSRICRSKLLSYYSGGPDGRNVLHAAVSRGRALPTLLEWFKDEVVVAVEVQGGDGDRVPLVTQLTSQQDKQTGSTPLHLAASLTSWPFWRILMWTQVWLRPSSATRLLLDANVSTAYQPDNKGLYPIHVAASSGCLNTVKALLERCPECATLRDVKGRTFLHVAAAKDTVDVVHHVCTTPELFFILNAQDKNGDTALHRAVHAGNIYVADILLAHPGVRADLSNDAAMTPADLSLTKIPKMSVFFQLLNPRFQLLFSLLLYFGGPYGESRGDLFCKKHYIPEEKKEGGKDKVSQKLTDATQVMGIVSVLVATVTFASAFTLPGGYQTAGGTPLLAGSYAFNAFVLADALAFVCSISATYILLYAGEPFLGLGYRFLCINVVTPLLMSCARSLVVAFALAMYMVLAPVARTLAIIVVVVVTAVPLLYGNFEAMLIMSRHMVYNRFYYYTRRSRKRPTILSTAAPVVLTFLTLLSNFWSFIIIFGLPAIIRK